MDKKERPQTTGTVYGQITKSHSNNSYFGDARQAQNHIFTEGIADIDFPTLVKDSGLPLIKKSIFYRPESLDQFIGSGIDVKTTH